MHPILFEIDRFKIGSTAIGPIRVHSFGLMLALAFIAAIWLAKRRAARFQFEPSQVIDASFMAAIFGVLGARVLFVAQEWAYFSSHPEELWSLKFQGLTSFGALLFGLGAYAVFAIRRKRSLLDVLDLVAPSALLGTAIGRIGCLLNGCCFGNVCTTEGFCVAVEGSAHLHTPAQLYDSLMNFAALAFVLWREKNGLAQGQMFALFLILHGLARFIYEFWRAGTVAQVNAGLASSTYWEGLPILITQAQAAAGGMVIAGLLLYIVYQRRATVQQQVLVT